MESGVHRSGSQQVHAGGKGVVGARAAAGIGQQSAVVTYLTPDSDRFLELASREGLHIVPILVPGRLRINLAIYSEETCETTIINAQPEIEPASQHLRECEEVIASLLGSAQWLVISGSLPSSIGDRHVAKIVESCRSAAGKVIFDSSAGGIRMALECSADVVRVNLREASEFLHCNAGSSPATDFGDVAELGRLLGMQLIDRGAKTAIVGLGRDGCVLNTVGESIQFKSEVVHGALSFGAGDSFVAALATKLADGATLVEATRFATAAGAASLRSLVPGKLDAAQVASLAAEVVARRLWPVALHS